MANHLMIITNNGAGLYSFRFELVEKIVKSGLKVTLVYPFGDRKQEFEEIGCKYIDLPFDSSSTNPLSDLKLCKDFKRVIKDHKPDVALLYTIKPCIYAGPILHRMHIPYICTVTGISPALISSKPHVRMISRTLSYFGYNNSSVVYFQNRMNEELFTKLHIARGKHKLVAGSGVNLSKFKLMDYPEDDGFIKLLYLGRVKKIKGIEELSVAIDKASKNGMKVKCRVVGDSGDNIPAFSKAVEDGIIEFTGPTNDVMPHIAWCDAVIMPSHTEGMSNVLQEASACGRPVLASDIPGCKEIFEDGITGFGFKICDPDSLLDAVRKFHNTPYGKRKEMGLAARKKMENEFDRNKVISVYYEKICELVGLN